MRTLLPILLLVLPLAGCFGSDFGEIPDLEDEFGRVHGGIYAVGAVSQLRFDHPRATASNWTVDSDRPDVVSIEGQRMFARQPGEAALQVYFQGEPVGDEFFVTVVEAEVFLRREGICGGSLLSFTCHHDFPYWATNAEVPIEGLLRAGAERPRGHVHFEARAEQRVERIDGEEALVATLGSEPGEFVLAVDYRIGEGRWQHQYFEMNLIEGPDSIEMSHELNLGNYRARIWRPKYEDEAVGGLMGETIVSLDGVEVGRGRSAGWEQHEGGEPQRLSVAVRGIEELMMARVAPGTMIVER